MRGENGGQATRLGKGRGFCFLRDSPLVGGLSKLRLCSSCVGHTVLVASSTNSCIVVGYPVLGALSHRWLGTLSLTYQPMVRPCGPHPANQRSLFLMPPALTRWFIAERHVAYRWNLALEHASGPSVD
jgi:hypothetical protein